MHLLKKLLLVAGLVLAIPESGHAVTLYHSQSGWVQGVCSHEITLDAQDILFMGVPGITQMLFGIRAVDEKGQPIGKQVLEVPAFASSNATRFEKVFWEGDCEAKALVIYWALGVVDGKIVDFLHNDGLSIQESPLKESVLLILEP